MKQLDQSSTLFFPMSEQNYIFPRGLVETKDKKKLLLGGVKQTAVFTQEGCNIQSDPLVKWFDKDKIAIVEKKRDCFLIAGVRVELVDLPSLRNNISVKKEVEAALKKITFDFEYMIKTPNSRQIKKEEGLQLECTYSMKRHYIAQYSHHIFIAF